tara:strand:- start:404 stop:814 length:411 start_codon:yes stop_codon:yes gene_type:complete
MEIEETTTDKINNIIKKHFNKYFRQHYITTNMNEWSALRRSMKKLVNNATISQQKEIEQLKEVMFLKEVKHLTTQNLWSKTLEENTKLKEQLRECEEKAIDGFIKEIETEFSNENWTYLEFVKERYLKQLLTKKQD